MISIVKDVLKDFLENSKNDLSNFSEFRLQCKEDFSKNRNMMTKSEIEAEETKEMIREYV